MACRCRRRGGLALALALAFGGLGGLFRFFLLSCGFLGGFLAGGLLGGLARLLYFVGDDFFYLLVEGCELFLLLSHFALQLAFLPLEARHLLFLLDLLCAQVAPLQHDFVEQAVLLTLGFEEETLRVEQFGLLLEYLFSEVLLVGNVLACIPCTPIHLAEGLGREDEDEGVLVGPERACIADGGFESLSADAHFGIKLRDVLLETEDVALHIVEFLFELVNAREAVVHLQSEEIDVLLARLDLPSGLVELCLGVLQLRLELRLLPLQFLHLLAVLSHCAWCGTDGDEQDEEQCCLLRHGA